MILVDQNGRKVDRTLFEPLADGIVELDCSRTAGSNRSVRTHAHILPCAAQRSGTTAFPDAPPPTAESPASPQTAWACSARPSPSAPETQPDRSSGQSGWRPPLAGAPSADPVPGRRTPRWRKRISYRLRYKRLVISHISRSHSFLLCTESEALRAANSF